MLVQLWFNHGRTTYGRLFRFDSKVTFSWIQCILDQGTDIKEVKKKKSLKRLDSATTRLDLNFLQFMFMFNFQSGILMVKLQGVQTQRQRTDTEK